MSRRLLGLIALLVVGTGATGANSAIGDHAIRAQDRPAPASQDSAAQAQRPRFSVNSELVLLSVTVKNNRSDYVTGLTQGAFTVTDNGVAQTLRFFMTEDAPATIGILVDNSGSMASNRDLVVSAATAFAETSNPEDELFAFTFNEDVRAALPEDKPFTSDPTVLGDALKQAAPTQGRTALYDAIARGLEHLELGTHQREVLVVVSDGDDNASDTRFEFIQRQVQASNVVVYGVQLVDPVEPAPSRRLKDLAEASGGEIFKPRTTREVLDTMQRIARDIRHTYVLAYEPSAATPESGLRRIRVTAQSPDRKKLTVRTRAGYLPGAATRPPVRTGETR